MIGKKIILCVTILAALATPVMADTFNNGGFENGDLSGWTQGGGYWRGGWPINTANYLPTGTNYNAAGIANSIVTAGIDPISGLNRVYTGSYAVRSNDSTSNYGVSVLSQTVSNYTDSSIYFAWQAVLQGSHGLTDSDNFTLTLTNDTRDTVLYNVSYCSADAAYADLFNTSSTYSNWLYTDWQVQLLDVSDYIGDTFTLTLLTSDCPYGAHAGYVYLDGFGGAPPIDDPVSTPVPEPSTFVMFGFGVAALATKFRNKLVRSSKR